MMTIPFDQVKEEVLKDPEVKAHYDELEEKYALVKALIQARASAGLTQEEIAQRMGTTQSAIARLEGGRISSLKTLFKYAKAAGVRPVIFFEPLKGETG